MSEPLLKREPLNRDRIVQAALAIADAEGLDALTMRRLAVELGAAPMAAYSHFRDKRELLAAVVDAVMAEVELPDVDGRWRKPIRRLAESLRRALLAHPAVMPAVNVHGAGGPATKAVVDRVHGIVRGAGFADEQAVAAVDTLYASLGGPGRARQRGSVSRRPRPDPGRDRGRRTRAGYVISTMRRIAPRARAASSGSTVTG